MRVMEKIANDLLLLLDKEITAVRHLV
jgi:hypothetical protein